MNEVELAEPQMVVADEQPERIVATAVEETVESAIAALEQRVYALETAVGEMRSVKASAAVVGRKTSASRTATSAGGAVDVALESLSVEQRIAVKSGLIRAGLL